MKLRPIWDYIIVIVHIMFPWRTRIYLFSTYLKFVEKHFTRSIGVLLRVHLIHVNVLCHHTFAVHILDIFEHVTSKLCSKYWMVRNESDLCFRVPSFYVLSSVELMFEQPISKWAPLISTNININKLILYLVIFIILQFLNNSWNRNIGYFLFRFHIFYHHTITDLKHMSMKQNIWKTD